MNATSPISTIGTDEPFTNGFEHEEIGLDIKPNSSSVRGVRIDDAVYADSVSGTIE